MKIGLFVIYSVVLFVVFCGIGLLIGGLIQYLLSRTESRIPGMILPILNGVNGLVGLVLVIIGIVNNGINSATLGIIMFISAIITTFVYVVIYKKARAKLNNVSELDKMTVQDLD